jgi:hypothetical protein
VGENDLDPARELLLADEVEAAFDGDARDEQLDTPRAPWVVLVAILAMAVMTMARHL